MKKTLAIILTALLALGACGGGDSDSTDAAGSTNTEAESTDSIDEDEEESDAADDDDGAMDDTDTTDGEEDHAPGLTAEEIDDPDLAVLGSYDINGDELEDGVDGPPTDEAMEVFALYTSLIPAEYREGVVSFVAIDQEESDGTDGALQDVSGPDGEPTGERYLALDTSGSSVELERTIVHETGHLIFVTPGDGSNTYADAFNDAFPPGDDYTPEAFVTEYAASVPEDGGEDIAESWAMFVYGGTEFAGDADDDGELDVVEDGTLAAEKVAFFEDYPELVQLKADILG